MAGWLDTPIADLIKNGGPQSDTGILPYVLEKAGQSYLKDNYANAHDAEQGLSELAGKYMGSGAPQDQIGVLESYLRQYSNGMLGSDYFVDGTIERLKKKIEGKSDEEIQSTINDFISNFAKGAYKQDAVAEAPATQRYIRQDAKASSGGEGVLGVPLAKFAGDFIDSLNSTGDTPIETPKDYGKNMSTFDSDWYDRTDRHLEVVTDGNKWDNRLDIREQFDADLKKAKEFREMERKKKTIAYDPKGALGSFVDNFMPKAEAGEKPKEESGLVNTVRDAIGIIDYMAPDGTNCTRTMGVVLKGTPYEGMVNIDQFEEMSEILHMKRDPKEYEPKAGDIAVVNGGEHMIMVTENGGFINNGFSRGGIWESDKSYDEYAGKGHIDYYITTSDYEKLYKGNTEKGAKELGIKVDKGKIYQQIYDAVRRSYDYEPATGKRYNWGG